MTILQNIHTEFGSVYRQKRIRRHIMLALIGGTLVIGIYVALSLSGMLGPAGHSQRKWQLSLATAYAGLTFLSTTLLIGPWNVLRNCPNPVSTDLRRDIGIWAGLLSLGHVLVGIQVHTGLEIWLNFLYSSDRWSFLPYLPLRNLFGLANYLGLGITLIIVLLLALSNNISLRNLGVKRWKAIQRLNYVSFVLLVLHGLAYQRYEDRVLRMMLLLGLVVAAVFTIQLLGFRVVWVKNRNNSERLNQTIETAAH